MEVGDVIKLDFTEELSPGKNVTIQATVMVTNLEGALPKVIYLKLHDGHTASSYVGFQGDIRPHILQSGSPASLHVYVKPEESVEVPPKHVASTSGTTSKL